MKITYDFSKCIIEGIKFCFLSEEIPYIHTNVVGECRAVWFAAICEEKKTSWFISIRQIENSSQFELRAAKIDPTAVLMFSEYILHNSELSGIILLDTLEDEREYLSRELMNYSELNAELNALIEEIETIEGSEIEILDLRNVRFWTDVFSAGNRETAEFLSELRDAMVFPVSDEQDDFPF